MMRRLAAMALLVLLAETLPAARKVTPTPTPPGGFGLMVPGPTKTPSPTPGGGTALLVVVSPTPTPTPPKGTVLLVTVGPTFTRTPRITRTPTPTRPTRITRTPTPAVPGAISPSPTPRVSATFTPSPVSPSPTPTRPSPTPTFTPSRSATATSTRSATRTPSATETPTPTATPTRTSTPTPTPEVLAPRILTVEPSQVPRGGTYKLELEGRNLSSGTKISFGPDVTIVGAPFVHSPTQATVEILVGPAAKLGVVAATAANDRGKSTGPGALLIAVVVPTPAPSPPKTPAPAVEVVFDQPTGQIILDNPCDPDALFSKTCTEPPLVTDSTVFVWHETNPGLAKQFVFEILDGDGKVLGSAMTTKPYFRMTAPLLAALPKLVKPKSAGPGKAGSVMAEPGGTLAPPAGTPKTSMELGVLKGKALAELYAAEPGKPAAPGMEIELPDFSKMFPVRSPVEGEAYWRVRGLGPALDEKTGAPTSKIIELEKSAERAILLPLPPNGFSCDGSPGSKLGTPVGRGEPWFILTSGYLARPKPCEGNSPNICSATDWAEIPHDAARLDLTRVPFPVMPVGDLKSSSEVTFQNVFIDWGDGSEPEKLRVAGGPGQSLAALRLRRKDGSETLGLRHRYKNGDPDASWVDYKIRVFALADQDETPEILVAWLDYLTSKKEGKAGVTSASELGGGAAKAAGAGSALGASGGSGKAADAALAGLSPSEATEAIAAMASGMYTIACTSARVHNPLGAGADDFLHLLSVEVFFPGEPSTGGTKKVGPGKSEPSVPKPPGPAESPSGKPDTAALAAGAAGSLAASAGPIPSISDCSSAFKATARITYWGHGRIRLFWHVDGELIETQAPAGELPPVSKADGEKGTKPWFIEMDGVLPAALQMGAHSVKVRVEGGAAKDVTKSAKAGFGLDPAKLSGEVTLGGSKYGPPPGGGKSSGGAGAGGALGELVEIAAGGSTFLGGGSLEELLGPHTEVTSKDRLYSVFDHKAAGLPCRLRYPTAESGVLVISDISALKQEGGGPSGAWSGSGMLQLFLPSSSGESDSLHPLAVSFSGWKLGPSSAEGEDVLDVLTGTLDQKLAPTKTTAAGFPLTLQRVRLSQQRGTLDGEASVGPSMGLSAAKTADLPKWEFLEALLEEESGFAFEKVKSVEAGLLTSGFALKIEKAEVDFSRKQGGKPEASCTSLDPGAKWIGIRLDGKLESPETVEVAGKKLLSNFPFEKWGVGPGGFDVLYEDPKFEKDVAAGAVKVRIERFELATCGSGFSAAFGVRVQNAPIVLNPFEGKLQIDEAAGVHPDFPDIAYQHGWGDVAASITHAELDRLTETGAWGVRVDAEIKFVAWGGGDSYLADYSGTLVSLDGSVLGPGGKTWFAAGSAAKASVYGFPFTVKQNGVGNDEKGNLWFGYRGDLEIGDHVPSVKDREAKFVLEKVETAVFRPRPREGFVLASLGAPGPALVATGYKSAESNGVLIQEAHLEFDYGKDVHITVDAVWEKGPGGYRFVGDGNVSVADTGGFGATVLFGRQKGESYWMVRAGLTFPAPIPFGTTPFGLFSVAGGLGYNITAPSYELDDVKKVVIDGSKDYAFSAAAEVGDLGVLGQPGFTLFLRGRLTIKLGDGFRLTAKAWALTGGHAEGFQMLEGCVQYLGGAFDAGVAGDLSVLDGAVSVKIPSGADVCTSSAANIHFGKDGWHIWMGTEKSPIETHILVVTAKGWLEVDGSGARAGLKSSTTHEYCVWFGVWGIGCDACAKASWGYTVRVGLSFSPPNVTGGVEAGISASLGVCGFSLGVSGHAKLNASLSPPSICGTVHVVVHTPNELPNIKFPVDACLP